MKLKTVLLITAVTTALLTVIINLHGLPLKVDNLSPYGIVDLEMAGTIPRATSIYTGWFPDLTRRATNNILIDFLFLISYGVFLYSACRALSKSFTHPGWKKAGYILSLLMLVAAAFDALENFLMLRTLSGHFNKEIIASTFIFASIKFLLAALGLLYIVASLVRKMFLSPKKTLQLDNQTF